ncbi:MAG: hypothetical protein KF723_22395 [Rhizobiaceae bacterium]|nr:hypothetical protein [Rhizobiaceae bacterium]
MARPPLTFLAASVALISTAAAYEIVDKSGTEIDAALLGATLADVADLFVDPEAVQFRRIRIGKEGALCGEVNAKNRLGGYVGFEPFYKPRFNEALAVPPPVLGITVRCR